MLCLSYTDEVDGAPTVPLITAAHFAQSVAVFVDVTTSALTLREHHKLEAVRPNAAAFVAHVCSVVTEQVQTSAFFGLRGRARSTGPSEERVN